MGVFIGVFVAFMALCVLSQIPKLAWVCAAFALTAGFFAEKLLPFLFLAAIIGVVTEFLRLL